MLKKIILSCLLVLALITPVNSQSTRSMWMRQISTNCSSITDAKNNDRCYETSTNTDKICLTTSTFCQPTDWLQVNASTAWNTITGDQSYINLSNFTNDANFISEAPNDNKTYGRKGLNWQEIVTTETDPIWSAQSVNYQTTLQADSKYLQDAPSDGKQYTRKDANWQEVNGMIYPNAGIAVSTGINWGTSIVDNSTNWNTAFNWGNHALMGYVTGTPWTSMGYLTSESDTLDSVTDRGVTTTNRITTGNHTITGDGSAKLIINAVPDENYGSGGDTIYNVTIDSQLYRVHKFTTVGTTTFIAPTARNLRVLVVGGGGGGGTRVGGGGGAGGFLETTISSSTYQNFSVTVGDGGTTGSNAGNNGGNSVFDTLIALGGGGGAGFTSVPKVGASGGGGRTDEGGGTATGANGTAGQGYKGGNGGGSFCGGGGGGAGGVGLSYVGSVCGNGGPGLSSNISGVLTYYAGGGGGGAYNTTPGTGTNYGGNGSSGAGSAATANTGSGGGGGGYPTVSGGKGGSGIVIVAYPINSGAVAASPEINFTGTGSSLWSIKNDGSDNNKLNIINSTSSTLTTLDSSGKFGIGVTSPTAKLHLPAGTTSALTAPLKFTSGTSMTNAEAGAMEYTTDDLFFTIGTGTSRKRLLMADAVGGLTSTRVPYATTNGRLTDASGFTFDGTILSVANLKDAGLTSGRVTFATTSGQLTDDADMTFSTDTLTATKIVGTTSVSTPSIITASGALGITPASGSNLNVTLGTTGDLAVNTNQLYVDTSTSTVGIGTATPSSRLDIESSSPMTVDMNSTATITGGCDANATILTHLNQTSTLIEENCGGTGAKSLSNTNVTLETSNPGMGTGSAIFNGTSSKITIPNIGISGLPTFTFEAMINPTTLTGGLYSMVSGGQIGEYYVGLNAGKLYFKVTTSVNGCGQMWYSYASSNALTVTTGVWQKIYVSFDGSNTVRFAIDGVMETITASATGRVAYCLTSSYTLGYSAELGYYNGLMDEVRISKSIQRQSNSYIPRTTEWDTVSTAQASIQYQSNGTTKFSSGWNGATSNYELSNGTLGTNTRLAITEDGKAGLGVEIPTATLHIKAGTATANTSPLKFTSGTLLSAPEAGAIEFLTDKFYGTITTGATRKEVKLYDSYYGGMYSYENANAITIEEVNVYHAVSASGIIAGSNNGFTFTAGVSGAIASVADYSGTVPGTILLTVTAGHNLTTGDYITLHGMTLYNGKYQVTVVSPTTFRVTKAYVSSQAGTYSRGARLVANTGSAGVYRVSYNVSGYTAANAKNIKFEIVKNLTDLDNTASITKYTSGTDYQNQHGEGMVTIADGDTIYLTISNKTDGTNYTLYMVNVNLIRM